MYNDLLLSGRFWTYLADLNEQAQNRLEVITEQMKAAEGITEELKRRDWLLWVQSMNNIRSRAEEIICTEMIFLLIKCHRAAPAYRSANSIITLRGSIPKFV